MTSEGPGQGRVFRLAEHNQVRLPNSVGTLSIRPTPIPIVSSPPYPVAMVDCCFVDEETEQLYILSSKG